MFEFEQLLVQVGVGRWHVKVIVFYAIVILLNGPTFLYNKFGVGKVNYECILPFGDNSSLFTAHADQCSYSGVDRVTNRTSEHACSAWRYSPGDVDTSLVGKYDLVCEREYLRDWDNSIMIIGQLVGSVTSNFLSDAFGRRTGSIIAVTASMLCQFGFLWSPSFWWLALFRFLESVFSMGAYQIPFTALSEITLGNWRAFLTALAVIMWGLSTCVAAVVSYFFRIWQHYTIFIALLNVPGIALLLFLIPESPRWLYAKGHYKAFRRIVHHMTRQNGKQLSNDLQQEIEKLEEQKSTASGFVERMKEASVGMVGDLRKSQFWMLFSTWRLFARMAILCYIWSANVVTYYAFLFGSDIFGVDIHIYTFMLGFFEMPASLLCTLLANFCGRRLGNFIMLMLTVVSVSVTCFVTPGRSPQVVVYLLPIVGRTLISAAFLNIYLWHVELMPTVYRNVGLGIGSASGRMAGIFFPYFDNLSVFWPPLTSLTLAVISLIAALLSALLPETKGQLLPDSIEEAHLFGTKQYKHLAPTGTAELQLKLGEDGDATAHSGETTPNGESSGESLSEDNKNEAEA